jgi:hypothetical protein
MTACRVPIGVWRLERLAFERRLVQAHRADLIVAEDEEPQPRNLATYRAGRTNDLLHVISFTSEVPHVDREVRAERLLDARHLPFELLNPIGQALELLSGVLGACGGSLELV